MKFPRIHKKHNQRKTANRRLLLTDPNCLIGYRINEGKLKLISVLGVGGNGVVYRAVECPRRGAPHPTEPRDYAVKVISKAGLDPREAHILKIEFELHSQVSNHPHIVTFHGIIEENDFFFVLLDYVPEGDIFDMMEVRKVYLGNDELIKSVYLQLIDAVEYMHNLGISHRDIKPENILCKDGGSYVLLADFGLGTDRKVVREYGVGSEPYMAPQCFGGFWKNLGPYSAPHADIWSLGVVLVNLACSRNPWHKATEDSKIYKAFLSNPNFLMEILPISVELNEILKRTFAINPHSRISLHELRHKVQVIQRFTLTDEELKLANPVVRNAAKWRRHLPQHRVTSAAPYALAVRQVTNLTADDINSSEVEARHDNCEASPCEERRSPNTDMVHDGDDDDDDVTCCPSLPSPVVSPSPTVVALESTLAIHQTTLDMEPLLPDSDDSDTDSDCDSPITPESHPAADVDVVILSIPEIDLNQAQPSELIAPTAKLIGEQPLSVTKDPQVGRLVERSDENGIIGPVL